MGKTYHINLGNTNFKEVWDLQREINKYKQNNKCNDIIISTEHSNVYTLGKSGDKNHLLLNDNELEKKKISYFEIDRGGDLTYHGPGQLVVYPILDLKQYYLDSHRYLRDLEKVIILTLKNYGIDSYRDEEYTGVWVNDKKICAIGIKISRWITMHGLAFNINNNLGYFDYIIPCGIFHKGVTSIKELLGSETDINSVLKNVLKNFEIVFGTNIEDVSKTGLPSFYRLKN
jgi:lipoyl(octanoyl) transferase